MPLKIRELKAKLRVQGFQNRPGKGSHTVWRHPLIPLVKITLAGHDGADAKPYQIKDVKDAIKALEAIKALKEAQSE